ncbi:bacterioferritin [Motiliproteus sp. SC1-56]|uniref:bacterioferritin n=1 Tax=Motiliproteus sp. SC1-56 TaxID=2799565 RepID=UPI001A8CC422|nr:bacterioferritin [Motiliproteus sp. SC1-56]
MKDHAKSGTLLNRVLTTELTGINQHFLHARMCRNWGYGALNDKAYHRSIEEMKDADDLIERVLFLEGLPNLQNLGKLNIGEDPQETLTCDLKLEEQKIDQLRKAMAQCEEQQDYVSRNLLAGLLEHAESHLDWLETQLQLISAVGLENYLQSQM